MFFTPKFYDKHGNFDNSKFIYLLKKAQKAKAKSKEHKYVVKREILIFSRVSQKELRQFINKLSIFINSGIDIKGALGMLVKQLKNPLLKRIVEKMKVNIDHGITMSETMASYPKVFDSLTVALTEVGEKTGQLGAIMSELDKNLLESITLKAKVKGAMIYPMILLLLTSTMVTFMMTFIVPKITDSFKKAGTELPALTQLIVSISNFFLNDWYILISAIIATILLFKIINQIHLGKIFFAAIAVKMPIFGYIVKQSNIIYFVKSFTILLDAGVLLLDAIKVSSKVVPNLLYKREIIRVKNEVEVGLTISKSLGLNVDYDTNIYLNKLFPEEFAYVVNTGEETGSLSDSLKKIGINYSIDLRRYIGNLATMLEPIIIVIVGFLVGTIVIAIMLPFFEMGKIAKQL